MATARIEKNPKIVLELESEELRYLYTLSYNSSPAEDREMGFDEDMTIALARTLDEAIQEDQ